MVLKSLVNRPNKVPEMQRFYQYFVFQRTPKDRFMLAIYGITSAVGLGYCLYGLGQMALGKGKKPGF